MVLFATKVEKKKGVGLWLKNAAGGRKRSGDREIARDRAAEKSWQSATVELPAVGMITTKRLPQSPWIDQKMPKWKSNFKPRSKAQQRRS
jgi:hypothetical protein